MLLSALLEDVDQGHSAVVRAREALQHPKRGTMRAWFEQRDGAPVTTDQWTTNPDHTRLTGFWSPGPRTIDATRATSVSMDGSVREYKGCPVVAAGPRTLVVHDKDMNTYIVYTEEETC